LQNVAASPASPSIDNGCPIIPRFGWLITNVTGYRSLWIWCPIRRLQRRHGGRIPTHRLCIVSQHYDRARIAGEFRDQSEGNLSLSIRCAGGRRL
jgi:hypothetical protein